MDWKPTLLERLQHIERNTENRLVEIKQLLAEIANNTKPLVAHQLLTNRRIFKEEAIELLKISPRTYDRHKANGLLKPRRYGSQDFFYPEDLEEAIEESKRRGRL